MQFVKGGPDIDERLLQAHEDGQVVFFCGAGVSYPAKLPSFRGLTEKLYEQLGIPPSTIEIVAMEKGGYDTAIGLIEGRIVGGRHRVRRAIAEILEPNLAMRGATKTHESLLQLAQHGDRRRLITTNFDPLFEIAKVRLGLEWPAFQAPLLPIPKNRWDGIVYLHGLLSAAPTDAELNNLVVSSGDFGLAYLTERWAARFVGELFRNYTVCFVGYSINDPVLRYMMDALAADRQLGEEPREHFAFGNYPKGGEAAAANEWAAKNVIPILYRNHSNHAYLHRTLQGWAETYRDGVRGKISIVTKYGLARPTGSTVEDDFVGRMLWALAAPSGDPARHFSQLDPLPSLDWLEPMMEPRFGHADLVRFGVMPTRDADGNLKFSLLSRPTPYRRASWMSLVPSHGPLENSWDDVAAHLAAWLGRHIENPKLLHWTIAQGGPKGAFRVMLERRMRENPPAGILGVLWQFVLDRRVQRSERHDLYQWREEFRKEGMTPASRGHLLRLLAPTVRMAEPYLHEDIRAPDPERPYTVYELVFAEIVLAADSVHYFLRDWDDVEQFKSALPALLPDFTDLLREAIGLMAALGKADEHHDQSYLAQPSIAPHAQNTDFRDWTALIDLTRDAWLASLHTDRETAWFEGMRWARIRFPLFRRMVFFAAATAPGLFHDEWVLNCLLDENRRWLWSSETQREAMQLVATITNRLTNEQFDRLQEAILAGPTPGIYREDIEPDKLDHIVESETYRLLNKVRNSGRALTGMALDRWNVIAQVHPEWPTDDDEQYDFPTWSFGGDFVATAASPEMRRDLETWLRAPSSDHPFYGDNWGDRCRDDFSRTLTALFANARRGEWNIERWDVALSVWWQTKYLRRSWCMLAPLVATTSDDKFQVLARAVSFWVREAAKVYEVHADAFFRILDRIARLYQEEPLPPADDILFQSVNHPVGHITDAALQWWYRQKIVDGERLRPEIEPFLTRMTDPGIEIYRYARAILSRHVIALFRVDPDWTQRHVLPFFDWDERPAEAPVVWNAFLHSPRLHAPLFSTFKNDFLKTASHYDSLGDIGAQYANLLTWAALELGSIFTFAELAAATASLPRKGLERASLSLQQALRSAGDRSAEYWINRVRPYLAKVWPKTIDVATPKISENFAMLCIGAGEVFPDAMREVADWLSPLVRPQTVVHALAASGISSRLPDEALQFLGKVVAENMEWLPPELATCLASISTVKPVLVNDPIYRRLKLRVERGH